MENSFDSFVRSFISIWIVGTCISGTGILFLIPMLPSNLFILWGAPCMFMILPAFWTCFFGIVGLPLSWPRLLETTWNVFREKGPSGALIAVLGTIVQLFIFRPFPCPEQCQWIPESLQMVFFRQPERIFHPPRDQRQDATVKDEFWILVNGVATTAELAKSNAQTLYTMVQRPIWICYVPTDGIWMDLLECILGKIGFMDWLWMTRPKIHLQSTLTSALREAKRGTYKRVVVIAHSQGTIVAANAFKYLENSDPEMPRLMREYLEVYSFANCCHRMPNASAKYAENLSNKCDTLAWLGILFPFPNFWRDKYGRGIMIGGSSLIEPSLWGHLLATHYLNPMKEGSYATSRLRRFFNGRQPIDSMTPLSSATPSSNQL